MISPKASTQQTCLEQLFALHPVACLTVASPKPLDMASGHRDELGQPHRLLFAACAANAGLQPPTLFFHKLRGRFIPGPLASIVNGTKK